MARIFGNIQMPDKMRLDVGVGILDRIADAGLRTEMDDSIDRQTGKRLVQRGEIGEIDGDEAKAVMVRAFDFGDAVALQRHLIIIVEVIDPDHLFAAIEQLLRGMKADETRSASDKHSHDSIPLRSEEHTSELQSLMRISYAVFYLN